MLICIPTLVFSFSNPKFIFEQIWDKKSQSCPFCLKIGTCGIWRMLILIPKLVFWNARPTSIFDKFGRKKSKLPILAETLHTKYLEDANSYSDFSSLNCKTWIHFGQIGAVKFKVAHFGWKLPHSISRMLILIPTLVFSISNPKFIFGEIYAQEVELLVLSDVVTHRMLKMLIYFIWNL